jgi:endonuclease-8
MPEGHTVHRLAIDLEQAFAQTRPRVSSPQGRFAQSAELISGRLCTGTQAHGKHLFVGFGGQQLHIHLGLIGKLRLSPAASATAPQGQTRVRIENSRAVAELTGPQVCELITPEEAAAAIVALGPDPLRPDADERVAWERIRGSSRPVAALLIDQTVLSGVGNVYQAEVLFRQRVRPDIPGTSLTRRSWLAIWEDLVELMRDGVAANRIDTVAAEHSPEAMGRPPRVDDHGGEVYVYRRAGQRCHVCGSRIRGDSVSGRNLFWCGRCQRRH